MEKKNHIVVAVVNAHTHKKEKNYIEKRKEMKGRNIYNNLQVKRADSHSRIRITDANARSW